MAKQTNHFGDIITLLDNEYAKVAEEGTNADVAGYFDTGSYALNALISGSIYGGMPANKITAIAGEEATGKTFFALGIVKTFLDADKNAICIIFETEGSITKEILVAREIDTKRVLIVPVDTIQQLKTQALRVVENHRKKEEEDRKPLLLVLDSLGMLSTSKEMADSESGKEVKDMTRAGEIKAAFRVLTNKLSKCKVPFVVTNHTYQTMGMFPTKEMGGGGGLKFAANNIIALSKSKEKDADGHIVGAIIRCKNLKSRLTREGTETRVLLSHSRGLDRYYGLIDIALNVGIIKKGAKKLEFPNGQTAFESAVERNPQQYFTEEILKKIDEECKKIFCYGVPIEDEEIVEEILNGTAD